MLALLGLSYFRASKFSDARPIYEELVERAASDASHRLNLGLVYLKLDQGELAIAALEASRALDPQPGPRDQLPGPGVGRAGRYADAYRLFLLAGQVELAAEIEINLSPGEREAIQAQISQATAAAAALPAPTPPPAPAASRAQPPPLLPPAAAWAAPPRRRRLGPTRRSRPPISRPRRSRIST